MKKFFVLACAALLFVVLKNTGAARFAVTSRAALPFHLARLYAAEPDARLDMPVEGVRVGQVGDSWHAPRAGGRLHEGQDIFARRGTPVRSATGGYVVRVGQHALGGNVVWEDGAGGRSYYYAHLDSFAAGLSEGDYVTPYSLLGYVGTTGNAAGTSPHLHFGVYLSGDPIDPHPLLADRPEASAREAPSD